MRLHHSGAAAPQSDIAYDSQFKIDRLGYVLPYLCKQLTGAIRLADIPIAARCSRLALVAAQRIGGDDDDRNSAQHRIGLEPTRDLIAIEHGNLNVHQDEVRPLGLRHCERLLSVFVLHQLLAAFCPQSANVSPFTFPTSAPTT